MVVSGLPVLSDVLEHKTNAFVTRVGDARDLAAGLRTVLDNPQLASRLRRNGREAATRFTWERRARSVLSFLQRVHNLPRIVG